MRMLAAWGSAATCHLPAGHQRRFQEGWVIKSPLSRGHTFVPLRMAAVRDAGWLLCGAGTRATWGPGGLPEEMALVPVSVESGGRHFSPNRAGKQGEASLSASTQGTHPGDGGSGAENQPPSANEAGALAWQGLIVEASGML